MRVLISVFLVSVKRQVERGAATTGRVSSSSRRTRTIDDDGEDYDSDGDFDSGDSDYTWLECERGDFHHAQN